MCCDFVPCWCGGQGKNCAEDGRHFRREITTLRALGDWKIIQKKYEKTQNMIN